MPGQHLFEYRGEDGSIQKVSSSDVNSYLRELSGHDITAKDFRTWAGTVKAAIGFGNFDGIVSKKATRVIVAMVADELGNTIDVCRKCYIHPAIIAGFENGGLRLRVPGRGRGGLDPHEIAVLRYLRRHS